MASIEKRLRNGKVSYRARYRDPSGRQRVKTFRRKVDAEKYLALIEAAKLRGTWTDPAHGKMTLAEWLETWWGSAADLRPSTVARDRAYLNSLVLPRFGSTPLAAITQPEIQAWVAQLTARGFAPATVVKAYQLLGRTLTAAVNADMIPRSPCRAVRLPKIEREEMRFLNPAEVARLADAIGPPLPRPGAAQRLRWPTHGRARRPAPRPRRSAARYGRHRRDRRGGPRAALHRPTQDQGRAAQHRAAASRGGGAAAHMGPVGPADAHVFTAEKGGLLRTSNFRVKVWLPAVRSVGLAPLRPHDLRHTAVALWIAASANPKEVSVRAGHTSVSFTLDRYGHLFPGHDAELRDRLNAMHAEGLQQSFGGVVVDSPDGPARDVLDS